MNSLLYPYYNELEAFVQTLPFYNRDLQITELVTPYAWKSPVNNIFEASLDFDESLKNVDGVIIADSPRNKFLEKDLIKKISNALQQRKNVFCYTKLQPEDKSAFINMAKENSVSFEYVVSEGKNEAPDRIFELQDCIVIGIAGLLQEIDSFSSLLQLVYRYRQLGYRVTAVSDNPNAALCGFVPFPYSLLDGNFAFGNAIHHLNSFYNQLQFLYQPDIIITQIPGGLMKYSNNCLEDFGVKAFMLSQAISIDYFILNSPVDYLNAHAFQKMSDVFAHRFNAPINAVGIVNKRVNTAVSKEMSKIQFDTLRTESVEQYVRMLKKEEQSELLFFNTMDSNAFENLVQNSIRKLI